jgi:hypothetical protein
MHMEYVAAGAVDYFVAEPERGDAIETRTYGGQGTEMPARWWVSKNLAVQAVRYFIEHGGRAPSADLAVRYVRPPLARAEGQRLTESSPDGTTTYTGRSLRASQLTHQHGRTTFQEALENGTQVWVEVWGGRIRDGGVNQVPRP